MALVFITITFIDDRGVTSPTGIVGWAALGTSTLLYIISYMHVNFHRRHKVNNELEIQPRLYLLAHFSIINFMLDFPGNRVPTVYISHYILIAFNTILVIIAVIIATAVVPIREAWRCYRPEFFPSVEDYKYGLCPPPNQHAPMCDNHPGIVCRVSGEDSFSQAIWNTEIHYLLNAILVSVAIYLASIPPKLEYWQVSELVKDAKRRVYSAREVNSTKTP